MIATSKLISLGFYHEVSRLDRDNYITIDFKEMEEYEIALTGRVTKRTEKQYLRCDRSKLGKKKGCQAIGAYDGDSIMHYPPTLTAPVLDSNGNTVDRTFRVFNLKESAHALCNDGRCNPGQRIGLSLNDINDIQALYRTTCGKKIPKQIKRLYQR